jgi:hypothetical protein
MRTTQTMGSHVGNRPTNVSLRKMVIVTVVFTHLPSPTYGFFRRNCNQNYVSSSFDGISSSSLASNDYSCCDTTCKTALASASTTVTPLRPSTERLPGNEELAFRQSKQLPFHDSGDGDGQSQNHEDLVFEGTFEYESELLPISTTSSPQDLLRFFLNPRNRDLVIKGGGNPTESVPASPELYDEWTAQSQVVDSTPPNGQNEEILAVRSDVQIAPGLSISAVSYTGCKVVTNPRNSLPFYEFTLVREDYEGKGSRPMVWVFNKITGKSIQQDTVHHRQESTIPTSMSSPRAAVAASPIPPAAATSNSGRGHDGSSRTYALSRITIEPDVKEQGCRVYYYGHVKVVSKLPKGLLHVLPLPKRTVEAKVSKSIVNQLEKEGIKSIDKFRDALEQFAESQQRARNQQGGEYHQ